MSDFLKNTNDFDSLNLSDISEVDPDEIEKIVKSAGELDKKYINLETLKTTFKENTPSSNSAIGVRSHQIPSEEIEGNDSKSAQSSQKEAVNLLVSEEVQFGGNPMSVIEGGRRRGRGSGDWLGLKDSPEESITTIGEKMDEGRSKRPPSAKGRLLSELFGDPKPQSETTTPFTDVERDANYLPSRGNRRAGSPRLLGNDVPKFPDDSKVFLDEPKLFPEEPKMILETPKVIPEVRKPAGQTPSVLPDWLLGGEKLVEQNKSEPTKNEVTDKKEIRTPSPGPPLLTNSTPVQTNEIVALLANVQKQLGSAMTKRNENLQNYMKVLMLEAERVLVHTEDFSERVNDTSVKSAEDRDAESTKNKNMELMKEKDDQIHSVQINLTDLELQNNRQRLEIDNLKVTHEMEIEMLKKNHSYELAVFESRIERMKASFDEIENEFKEKIAKLKENETSLLSEHKERLERAEKSRLAEVEKLGELHQAALQQALALSLPLNNAGRVIRIPLITNPPKDETELSERETALLEKERQIEVLKGVLELEKEELEGKRLELEDRDRDLRRKEKGAKVREEAREAEAARERSQLDALALQIKLMREEAIREQGEIAKEKLELAAERARLEATYSIQGRTDTSIPPLDIIQARVEVEAALETAKEAKEAAENERRKHAERRHTVEQISWEQKEADLRLDNREKHLMKMLENAEKIRDEGFAALEEAKDLKSETDRKENDIQDQIKRIEAQERILSKERLDIAKEKIELERKRSQLDIFLPDLLASEDLSLNVPRVYVDPKAVILRLKAEREFESATLFPT